jgi:hypothetical protein
MSRPTLPRRAWWSLSLVALTLAACNSGPGHASTSGSSSPTTTATSGAQLQNEDITLLSNLTAYLSKADGCKRRSSPVVCLEAADRTLGGQIHDYANTLAGGGSFGAKAADVSGARDSSQLLANSMEILGDAQPSQANYNRVLNTFNVDNAISSLQKVVAKVQRDLG